MEECNCMWTLGIKGLPPLSKGGTATHVLHPQPQLVLLCSTPHEIHVSAVTKQSVPQRRENALVTTFGCSPYWKSSKSSTSSPACSLPQMTVCMSSLCSFLIARKTNQHTHLTPHFFLPCPPTNMWISSPYHLPGQQKFKSNSVSPGEMPPWEISCRSHSQVLLFTAHHCQYPSLLCSLVLCRPYLMGTQHISAHKPGHTRRAKQSFQMNMGNHKSMHDSSPSCCVLELHKSKPSSDSPEQQWLWAARPARRHSSASQELGTSCSPPRLNNSAVPAPDQKSEFRKPIPSFPDLPKVNLRLFSFKTPAQLNSTTFSCFSVSFYNNNQRLIIRKDGLKQAGVWLQAAPHSDSKWHILWAQWDLRHESSAVASWDQGLQEIFL